MTLDSLYEVCMSSSVEELSELLDRNAICGESFGPLFLRAVQNENDEFVILLANKIATLRLCEVVLEFEDPESRLNSFAWLCGNGRIRIVKQLLTKSHNYRHIVSGIKHACVGSHIEVVEFLLKRCTAKSLKDHKAVVSTILSQLITSNNLSILSFLLTKPGFQIELEHVQLAIEVGDVSIVDKVYKALKYPPTSWILRMACTAGKINIIKYLLSDGIEINGPALRNACIAGHVDTTRFLLDNGATRFIEERYRSDGNALAHACINGHLPVVELLCSYPFDYCALGQLLPEAIITCVEKDRMDIISFLIQNGLPLRCILNEVSINNSRKLVQCATEKGIPIEKYTDWQYDLGQLAELDCRAVANFPDRLLIANVLNSSCIDIVPFRSLLEAGIEGLVSSAHYLSNKLNDELLFCNKNPEVITVLTEMGWFKDILSNQNRLNELLLYACRNLHWYFAEYLIAYGAVFIVKNSFKAVLFCVKWEDISHNLRIEAAAKTMSLMISSGFDINMIDSSGKTFLMIACQHYMLDIIAELVEKGANVSTVDNKGRTALDALAMHKVVSQALVAEAAGESSSNAHENICFNEIKNTARVLVNAGATAFNQEGKVLLQQLTK